MSHCCHGKRAYATRKDAKKALRQVQSMGMPVKSTYYCPECGRWHLTKQVRAQDGGYRTYVARSIHRSLSELPDAI